MFREFREYFTGEVERFRIGGEFRIDPFALFAGKLTGKPDHRAARHELLANELSQLGNGHLWAHVDGVYHRQQAIEVNARAKAAYRAAS